MALGLGRVGRGRTLPHEVQSHSKGRVVGSFSTSSMSSISPAEYLVTLILLFLVFPCLEGQLRVGTGGLDVHAASYKRNRPRNPLNVGCVGPWGQGTLGSAWGSTPEGQATGEGWEGRSFTLLVACAEEHDWPGFEFGSSWGCLGT